MLAYFENMQISKDILLTGLRNVTQMKNEMYSFTLRFSVLIIALCNMYSCIRNTVKL